MSKHKATRLSARDYAILHLADRLRVLTIAILRKGVLAGLSRSGASKIVNRLVRSQHLCGYTLFHPTRYFVLGDQGARLLGRTNHRTLPLGPQALPIEYTTAVYRVLGRTPRKRLMRSEVQEIYSWLTGQLMDAPMCIDEAHSVLELLRVDLGGPVDHIARKCRADIDERSGIPEFNALIKTKCFRLVVITGTKEKLGAIKAALGRHQWPPGLLIHCSVVSELLLLTARNRHA